MSKAVEQLSWPQPYQRLAEAFYQLRRDFGSGTLLGSSLVHPRHPIPAEHHALLKGLALNTFAPSPSCLYLFFRQLICLLSALYDSAVLLLLHFRFSLPNQRVDVVIKTWVLNKESLWKTNDFYMGHLSPSFSSLGNAPILLAGDGRPDDGRMSSKLKAPFLLWDFIKETLKTKNPQYLPEILFVPILFPLMASLKQIFISWRLKRYSKKNKKDVILAAVAGQCALDVLRPYTTKNLSHGAIGKGVMRKWSPKMVITLYEGQPWEKVFWGAIKKASPGVCLIGYQHTVVMPHSLALIAPVNIPGEVPVPDVVIGTGREAQKIMAVGHEKFPSKFLVYGSHRRVISKKGVMPPRPSHKRILVLPEGTKTESLILFDCAIEMAKFMPDTKFVFRCHPLLPFKKVKAFLKSPIEHLPNIEVSSSVDIESDFEASSGLLYRGSSAAFYAVLAGVKPFCYWVPPDPNIDPLWFLKGWRDYSWSTEELMSKMSQYAQMSAESAAQEWGPAQHFLDGFTQSADSSVVAELVKSFPG